MSPHKPTARRGGDRDSDGVLRRVVIADEDTSFRSRLAVELRGLGWSALEVEHSTELLQALQADPPLAVVFEPNLQGHSWYTLLEKVRVAHRSLPMFVTTAFPSEAMRSAIASLGFNRLFEKPVCPRAVCQMVTSDMDGGGAPVTQSIPDGPQERVWQSTSLARLEWEHINWVLVRSGSMVEAARILGIPRQTLYRKLRKYPPSS